MTGTKVFGREIMSLVYAIHRAFEKERKDFGGEYISAACGKILVLLAENRDRDICQRDLEVAFDVRRSSISKVLTNMEEKGLIRREKIDGDARLKKIVLTESAEKFITEVSGIHEEITRKTLDGIDKKDLDTFYKVVAKMRENIQKD